MAREYGDFLVDHKVEPGMRGAQRPFDVHGSVAVSKNESEIARALRERNEMLIGLAGDAEIIDAGHASGRLEPFDASQDAAPRNRNHHNARGAPFAHPRVWPLTKGMSQEQLLERENGSGVFFRTGRRKRLPTPFLEAERSSAEAADGTGGHDLSR